MIINDITNRSVGQALNNSRSITHATKSEPCPHCGKPDWCYSLGELSVCKRGADPTTGWIRTSKQDKDGDYFFAPEKIEKAIRPKSKQEFIYRDRNGQPLVKVSRSDDGDGHRRFFQSHWDGANWQKGLTPEVRRQIPIYRYKEVQEAIALGKPIFFVEGEGVANCLWDLGLAATTTIGGSKGYRKYGDGFIADLDGATELILCPDRDKPGLEYMDEAFKDFPSAKWLYAPPNDFYWGEGLPKSDGLDLKDWVNDGASLEMILSAIEDRKFIVDKLDRDFEAEDSGQVRAQARSENKRAINFLDAKWGEHLKFNEMSLGLELEGKPMDIDNLSIQIADEFDYDIGADKAVRIASYLAKRQSYHPVKEYLERVLSLYPDSPENKQIFESISSRYFGTEEPLYDAFITRTMIGAVQRVFEPGCQHDTICTLQGKQGLRKSTFWSKLSVFPEWFDDSLNSSNSSDKDERLKLRGSWILELAEIEAMFRKKEISAFRGFVTTKIDKYRVPYGRKPEPFPRTSIFVGSVNPSEFLVDPEGHRRFWIIPIKCDRIPTEQLEKERDILWAMAVHAYKRGESNYLNSEQEKRNALLNKRYEISDSWQEVIEFWLESQNEVTISQVLEHCLKIEVGRHDRQSQMRVSHILKSLGMEKQEKRKISGKVSQFWGKVATRSQPGRNQVATEVATYSNPCREGDTEKRLLPFKEKTTETFPENKSVVIHSEIYSKETLDIGSNPKVATSPETVIQQGLEAVATPVATSEENYDIHEANAELIRSAESYEQIKALAEEWDKSFKQQVWGCLNERDRKRIAELKVSSRECPKAADEEPIYRDEQAIQSAFIKLQSSIRSQTLDWSAREIATDLLAKAYEKLDPLEQAAFRIWEDAQSDRDEED